LQDYLTIAKAVNETVEIWCTSVEWFSDDVLPVACQARPKELVGFQGIDTFISQIYDLGPGAGHWETVFGRNLNGPRMANPENPRSSITKCSGANSEIQDFERTLEMWESLKQPQEQFNRRLYEISSTVEPANAKLVITVGLGPAEPGRRHISCSSSSQAATGILVIGG
jgi:hypothetical protein